MAWNDKRPMSPHLQIYKLPMTARLSVLHRGTGAALSFGAVLMVWVLASAAGGEDSYSSMHAFLASWFGHLVLIGFTFSLYYHFCNGIRHLLWDIGKGLELESTEKSGKMVIAATVVLTVLTWLVAL
jgi:succinate dehydrogenase / fumarate reductase cytochrome b subunit